MEDLTGTLLKLGVVSFQLPCNDNMVLSELMDRLRRIKEVKTIQEQEKQKKKEAKEEKKKRKVTVVYGMGWDGMNEWMGWMDGMDNLSFSHNLCSFLHQYRLPVSRRRQSQFAARRHSIKPLPTEASPGDVEEFRHELNETNLGCRLLQQLSPVSNILYTHFVGSLPSSSARSSPEGMDLAVAVMY